LSKAATKNKKVVYGYGSDTNISNATKTLSPKDNMKGNLSNLQNNKLSLTHLTRFKDGNILNSNSNYSNDNAQIGNLINSIDINNLQLRKQTSDDD